MKNVPVNPFFKKDSKFILKKETLKTVVNSSENQRDFAGNEIVADNQSKAKNINELKKLVKVLESLITSGKDNMAQTYLDGFLESKNVKNLQDYLGE